MNSEGRLDTFLRDCFSNFVTEIENFVIEELGRLGSGHICKKISEKAVRTAQRNYVKNIFCNEASLIVASLLADELGAMRVLNCQWKKKGAVHGCIDRCNLWDGRIWV